MWFGERVNMELGGGEKRTIGTLQLGGGKWYNPSVPGALGPLGAPL